MSYIKIAQAGLNEWGGTHGGQPGNQKRTEGNLDGELNVREWYNKPWKMVLRPIDSKKADIIARTAYNCVRNAKIGYNQDNRQSLYWQMKGVDWDASKVGYCDTDCSSLWGVCCNSAGIEIDPVVWTGIMEELAVKSGQFKVLKESKYLTSIKYLKKGDALLTPYDHTAIVIDETVEEPIIPDPEEVFDKTYVTTAKLWLRKGPGTNYPTIIAMDNNTEVLVSKVDGNWARVQYGTYLGWSSLTYMKRVPEKDYNPIDFFTTGDVNIRESAGTKYKIVGVIPFNTRVRSSGRHKDVGSTPWYEVSYNGATGFVSSKYLRQVPQEMNFITTGKVNMRKGPSTDYDIVTVIDINTKVKGDGNYVDAQGVRWYSCTYGKNTGYVSNMYLEEVR